MAWKLFLIVSLMLFGLMSYADAQTLPGNPPSLAQALAAAKLPVGSLALAVGADTVPILTGSASPDTSATVSQVAEAYGGITQSFGDVTAVAPSALIALNPNPHDPNIYDSMTREEVLSLFGASLNNDQWRALTSEGGLGLNDLSTDDQRALFLALFPGSKLILHRSPTNLEKDKQYFATAASGGGPDQADAALDALDKSTQKDMSSVLPQARLRLEKHTVFGISSSDSDVTLTDPDDDASSPEHWEIVRDDSPRNTFYGVTVRAMLANTSKPGDLDFESAALSDPVTVTGCRTVGDLVTAISKATHLELYADRRWENKPLTVAGAQSSVSARDLLRALALCLGGAYRKVGPAYVLTNDLEGIGTIRRRWIEFQADAEARKKIVLAKAQKGLGASHSWHDLAWSGDPLDPTADQQKHDQMTGVPFDQLDAAQQAFVQRFIDERLQFHTDETSLIQKHPAFSSGLPMSTRVLTPGGRVTLSFQPRLELLLPSLKSPVTLPVQMFSSGLFGPPHDNSPSTGIAASPGKPLPLSTVLRTIPRRAILAHPCTRGEVDALVAMMKKAKMNALYLDVFSDGVSRLGDRPNILDEALARTRGSGIAVFPTLDLFRWGGEVQDNVTDLNILGETSVAAMTRIQARQAAVLALLPFPLFVSPFSPDVNQTLVTLTRQAARPGVAGIVWRDAAVPGYAAGDDDTDLSLGYLEAARLSFLRRNHVDPLDVSIGFPADQADFSLPNFDGPGADPVLEGQWEMTRVNARLALLRSRRAECGTLPVLVERTTKIAGIEDWYGSWDNPQSPLPEFHASTDDVRSLFAWGQAQAQSHLAMRVLSPQDLLSPDAGVFLQNEFQSGHWSGFVLEADTPSIGSNPSSSPHDMMAVLTHVAHTLHSGN